MSTAAAAAPAALHVSHILAPVDFSDASDRAVDRAAELARRFSASLTLLHAVSVAPVAYAVPEGVAYSPAGDVVDCQVADRAARLDRLLRDPAAPSADRLVVQDDPVRAILDYATEHRCDLIVMPTHGYGALHRLLLGSVTAEVIRSAPCPVWTGPHPDTPAPPAHGPVLCAVDVQPRTPAVLAWAAAYARACSAPLEVVYAMPLSAVRCGGVAFDPDWHIDTARDIRQLIDRFLRESNVEAQVSIEIGDIPGPIVDRAREIAAAALVIGRGPHAYSIVRESPGAVVVV